jgi:DNA-binding NarL/FixJ family response regulator
MIRILIADDHSIVRGGLKQIIATTTDIMVVGEAAQGSEVIDQLRTCQADLLGVVHKRRFWRYTQSWSSPVGKWT